MTNKEILLTAGKFVPVSKATLMNVSFYIICGCKSEENLFKITPTLHLFA